MRVNAIVKDGKIEPLGDVPWPDGTELVVRSAAELDAEDDPEGILETDPESITRWLADWNALPPSPMSDEQYAAFQAELRAIRGKPPLPTAPKPGDLGRVSA